MLNGGQQKVLDCTKLVHQKCLPQSSAKVSVFVAGRSSYEQNIIPRNIHEEPRVPRMSRAFNEVSIGKIGV